MGQPRRIQQPGPALPERIVAVEGRGRAITLTLEAGRLLVETLAEGFLAQGFAGGTVDMAGVVLSPFAYVMPALSKTGDNAAFYSDIFRPAHTVTIDQGQMSLGRRDGKPFFHCHALWREEDDLTHGGHLMPDETRVAHSITVQAYGVDGAVFEANPDPETNFKLFGPVSEPDHGSGASQRCFALRLRPNEDFHAALEDFCRHHGITEAKVYGGVGSTIEARFADGRATRNFATEVFINHGEIVPDATGNLVAHLDVGLVDYQGETASGVLLRGDNPVLMTFELVLAQTA